MFLALLLSAALVPQVTPEAPPEAAPAAQAAPAPEPEAPAAAAPTAGAASSYIETGLAAFRRRRLSAARSEFEKALAADPESAAANFYLGYTLYKLGEPSHRMNDNKERAKELFAKAFSLDPSFTPVWGAR